jgi:hypothetical protein
MKLRERISAHLRGDKLVRLSLSPRAGGYFFVNSPDLRGFSIMLHPGEMESFDSLSAALVKPLEAFITAEYRAYLTNEARKVRVTTVHHRPNSPDIQAQWCTA